ncbi:uncharacterized protein MONOS_18468 [Monocercomonoides exilis]|uniref:uncharacterized protein n=1 Tax=Monocercomonoides exilis TaxID=2049356 RepID=UPI00355A1EEF|nr:hypothetical protein MONOS_18468 [Monocercomonoides exilis]
MQQNDIRLLERLLPRVINGGVVVYPDRLDFGVVKRGQIYSTILLIAMRPGKFESELIEVIPCAHQSIQIVEPKVSAIISLEVRLYASRVGRIASHITISTTKQRMQIPVCTEVISAAQFDTQKNLSQMRKQRVEYRVISKTIPKEIPKSDIFQIAIQLSKQTTANPISKLKKTKLSSSLHASSTSTSISSFANTSTSSSLRPSRIPRSTVSQSTTSHSHSPSSLLPSSLTSSSSHETSSISLSPSPTPIQSPSSSLATTAPISSSDADKSIQHHRSVSDGGTNLANSPQNGIAKSPIVHVIGGKLLIKPGLSHQNPNALPVPRALYAFAEKEEDDENDSISDEWEFSEQVKKKGQTQNSGKLYRVSRNEEEEKKEELSFHLHIEEALAKKEKGSRIEGGRKETVKDKEGDELSVNEVSDDEDSDSIVFYDDNEENGVTSSEELSANRYLDDADFILDNETAEFFKKCEIAYQKMGEKFGLAKIDRVAELASGLGDDGSDAEENLHLKEKEMKKRDIEEARCIGLHSVGNQKLDEDTEEDETDPFEGVDEF